jgi:hypothetical protein
VRDDQTGDGSSYSVSSPGHTGWNRSQAEKAEALTDNLETQFLPVTDPSIPAVIEMIDVALRSYFLTPVSERKLTTPDEVQETIKVLRSARLRARTASRTGP